ncbi:hypothetical protein BDW59DRAFT_156230 [Aspergillus cavernicola]|uniref:Uncharacterized protein n=1 Tax=Aspergillus cavernicola TaxID=176166 RepID=A0ABR4J2V2_9EURO
MTAPLSGRQSPPPECQTGAQENDPPGSGRVDAKFAPPPEYAPNTARQHSMGQGDEAQMQLAGLTSNPTYLECLVLNE